MSDALRTIAALAFALLLLSALAYTAYAGEPFGPSSGTVAEVWP